MSSSNTEFSFGYDSLADQSGVQVIGRSQLETGLDWFGAR